MDPNAMTTLLGDAICNVENEEYWEASQHALKSLYELKAHNEDKEGGVAPSDDDEGRDDESDSVIVDMMMMMTAAPIVMTK